MFPRLDQLLNSCTVKIKPIGASSHHGTGFFIAPSVILTCAHVVNNVQVGQCVEVFPNGYNQAFLADVKEFLPDNIDLALLQLRTAFKSQCVYLDSNIQPGDNCYTYGYTDKEGNPEGDPVTLECEGFIGGSGNLIKLKSGQVRPGLSGSPLLNYRTGKICGVIKSSRHRTSDLGGEAVFINIIFDRYPKLIQVHHEFHRKNNQWSILLDPDVEPYDSDWTYLDEKSQKRENYRKALCFLIKVLFKWLILGTKAPRAFPFKTITSLIEHTFKSDLGQEIKKQRVQLTQRLNIEVDKEAGGQARILNELDSQAWVLNTLINIFMDENQDLASISRLLWANEIIYEQRSLIQELKNIEGNSYPELEAFKKKYPIFDEKNDTKYIDTDRIIGKIVAQHTDTNLLLYDLAKILLQQFIEQIKENPRYNFTYISYLAIFFKHQRNYQQTTDSIDAIFTNLENEIKGNPKLKVLPKVYLLLKSVVGEKVEGGQFRAWNKAGCYHFSRKCKLYPERAKPEEMKKILCYETRQEAEEKNHKPCKICLVAEREQENNDIDFIGEEPG